VKSERERICVLSIKHVTHSYPFRTGLDWTGCAIEYGGGGGDGEQREMWRMKLVVVVLYNGVLNGAGAGGG
jgi:hypothetical protein